jgi:hypothetical protein
MNASHHFHKAVHHLRYTRPKWYHEYHKWEHHSTVHWVTFALSAIVMFLGFVNTVMLLQRYPLKSADADSGSTTVTQQVNAGTLTISPQANASLSTVTVNAASSQNSTGNLGTVTVTDNRGSGVGWSATATSTNFTFINAAVKQSGSNNTVTSGGTYSNSTGGTYTITITTGGAAGAAEFSVSGLESASNQTTGSGVAIGSRGVTATFASATYVIGDSWTIRVDTIPVTNLTFTPNAFTTISGSSTGVSNGSAHTFSNTSDATTIMSATAGNGMGSYSDNPALQLSVPAATYANSYTATVTETVN